MDITNLKRFNYYLDILGSEFKNVIDGGTKELEEIQNFAKKTIKDNFQKNIESTSKEKLVENIKKQNKSLMKGGNNEVEYIKKKLDEIELIIYNSNNINNKNINIKLKNLENILKNDRIKNSDNIYKRLNILKEYIKNNRNNESLYNNIIIFILLLVSILVSIYYYKPEIYDDILNRLQIILNRFHIII